MRCCSVVLLATLVVALIPRATSAGNGDPVDRHPNSRECAILALTKACRQGPQAYRDAYLHDPRILTPKAYPAVPPLYWTLPLNRSARAHSIDMATTPCFQHDSCDGTDAFDRIRSYYKDAAALGENIASGYESPLETVNKLLLDGGAADFTTPLVSGSHVLEGGKITFLASFNAHSAGSPREAALELGGETLALKLAFGSRSNGTYRVTVPAGDACRGYRFRFRDAAGRTWWHPEGGTLYTTGEGGCEREYQPSGARTP